MSRYPSILIVETFVPVPNPQCVANQLCTRCYSYCLSIDAVGDDRLLAFEDGRAILRPADAGLHVRIEGRDLVVFCGVRTLLQGQLATVTTNPVKAVEWKPGGQEPFGTLELPTVNGRN